jgi:hypothetical protein
VTVLLDRGISWSASKAETKQAGESAADLTLVAPSIIVDEHRDKLFSCLP